MKKVQIRKLSSIGQSNPYGSDDKGVSLYLEDDIYNNLKTITSNEKINSDYGSYGFRKFLKDMESLHKEIIDGDQNQEYPQILIEINEYLGSLDNENVVYPLKNDIPKDIMKKLYAKYEPGEL
jgi:uncharacterized FAD-dependent dehydrogenase